MFSFKLTLHQIPSVRHIPSTAQPGGSCCSEPGCQDQGNELGRGELCFLNCDVSGDICSAPTASQFAEWEHTDPSAHAGLSISPGCSAQVRCASQHPAHRAQIYILHHRHTENCFGDEFLTQPSPFHPWAQTSETQFRKEEEVRELTLSAP